MLSEVLKIIPKMDEKDLRAMQQALQNRFTKLTKSFGKGLVNVLKGGGIAGIALGLIDKLLNPLKEVQDAIERTLKTSDDLATNARAFDTSTGKLFKLVTIAKATGLDQDTLFMMLQKFQTNLAQARANPNDPSVNAVKNFIGSKDTVDAFFNFVQQLSRLDSNKRVLVENQTFGEKNILKMNDFVQTIGNPKDLADVIKNTGIDKATAQKLTKDIDSLSHLNDLADALSAGRDFRDVQNKAGAITEEMVRNIDKADRQAKEREDRNIANFNNLEAISITMDRLQGLAEQGIAMLGGLVTKVIPFVEKTSNAIDRLMKSSWLTKGIKLFGGGKDD